MSDFIVGVLIGLGVCVVIGAIFFAWWLGVTNPWRKL